MNPPPAGVLVSFAIKVVNQKDPEQSVCKDHYHHFVSRESDRGFKDLLDLNSLRNPANGFLVNDQLIVEVNLQKKIVSGRDFYNMNANYDSKQETGFVGLANQGATCYMNSLLQALYCMPAFRSTVYNMNFDDVESNSKNVPLALARVFLNLHFSKKAVSTQQLTQSFGWNSHDAFMQHDVQELSRVLLDNLEERMKGTPMEGRIAKLLTTQCQSFVECINVNYASTRSEPLYDLQLVVKGYKTLEASLNQYVEVEILDKENQYRAEGFGKQDARKGSRFLSFPPILMMHLRRFEYDMMADRMIKVNDRFEFPTELDLRPWHYKVNGGGVLQPNADGSWPPVADDDDAAPIYYLQSVLVHSGGVHGGHYYVYIRPAPTSDAEAAKGGKGSCWFKFDDEYVMKVTRKEAVTSTYGGQIEYLKNFKTSSAYLLIYAHRRHAQQHDFSSQTALAGQDIYGNYKEYIAREAAQAGGRGAEDESLEKGKLARSMTGDSEGGDEEGGEGGGKGASKKAGKKNALDSEVSENRKLDKFGVQVDVEVPIKLKLKIEKENANDQAKALEESKAHLYLQVRVVKDTDLYSENPMGTELLLGNPKWHVQQMKKTDLMTDLRAIVQRELHIPVERQQYFLIYKRTNDTTRPHEYVPKALDPSKEREMSDFESSLVDFLVRDCAPDFNVRFGQKFDKSVLLFFKFFDVLEQKIVLTGSAPFLLTQPVVDVVKYIRGQPGLSVHFPGGAEQLATCELELWEEENAKTRMPSVKRIQPRSTIAESKLLTGDIVCFQRVMDVPQLEAGRVEYFRGIVRKKIAFDIQAVALEKSKAGEKDKKEEEEAARRKRREFVHVDYANLYFPADAESMSDQELVRLMETINSIPFCPNFKSYITYLVNRMTITFYPLDVNGDLAADFEKREQRLPLFASTTQEEGCEILAYRLKVDPLRIRLTKHNQYTDCPETVPIRQDPAINLDKCTSHRRKILYYEILPYATPILETHTPFTISLLIPPQADAASAPAHKSQTGTGTGFDVHTLVILLPKDAFVSDLIAGVEKQMVSLGLPAARTPLRLVESKNHKMVTVHAHNSPISQLPCTDRAVAQHNVIMLQVEPTPPAELNPPEDATVLWFFHASQGHTLESHSFPFSVLVARSDTLGDVKKKIQSYLKIPETLFAKWRCAWQWQKSPSGSLPLSFFSTVVFFSFFFVLYLLV